LYVYCIQPVTIVYRVRVVYDVGVYIVHTVYAASAPAVILGEHEKFLALDGSGCKLWSRRSRRPLAVVEPWKVSTLYFLQVLVDECHSLSGSSS
jgi:hypothetical protein